MLALEHAGVGPAVGRNAGAHTDDPLLRRIRTEFLEMPGLCLTTQQAAKLWNLDAATCEAVLRELVDAHILTRTDDGRYAGVWWGSA